VLAFCRRWVPILAPRRVTESCSRSKIPLDLFAPPALDLHDWLERRENIGGPGQILWPAVQSLDAAVAHLGHYRANSSVRRFHSRDRCLQIDVQHLVYFAQD
jgi:hypothetical protein